MADNTTLNSGSGGDTIATDDVAGVKYQRVKISFGADGAASDVVSTATTPFPVALSDTDNAVLDTIDAVLDTINAKLVTGTVIGDVNLGATDNAVLDNIDADTSNIQTAVELIDDAVIAVDSAVGTTKTILGGAIRDDALSTLTPIEGDATYLRVDSEGALWVTAKAGAAQIVDDAAFTPATTEVVMVGFEFDDTTPDSVNEGDGGAARMSANRNVYTQIRDAAGNERGVNVNASNQLAIAGPVTNAGTFAVQESGGALTALQIIDDWDETDRCKVNPIAGQAGVAGGSGTVGATTQRVTLATDVALPTGTNTIGKVQPFDALKEGGLTELIGINEQVDQNDYCGSVSVALGGTYSGEILSIMFYSTEDGSGAVQTPAGWLYIFDADPTITSGDTSITAAERVTILGRARLEAQDWETDANGGTAYIFDTPIPFHALATLYFSFKLTSATSLNDAAGDDEQLEFNFWYRRDS